MRFKTFIIAAGLSFLAFSCAGSRYPDPGLTARGFGSHASLLFSQGNLTSALSEYRRAYVAAARVDLPLLKAQYLFNIGRVWFELCSLDSAAAAFAAAYRDYTYYKDTKNAASVAAFIALVHAKRGDHDSAYAWYSPARPAELKDPGETAFWLTIQAILSIAKSRNAEASSYLDKAAECHAKMKNSGGLSQIEYYRAAIAFSERKFDESRALLENSLRLMDRSPDRYRRWRVLSAAATVSFCMHDSAGGERYYRRVLDCVPKGIPLPSADMLSRCPAAFWEGAF